MDVIIFTDLTFNYSKAFFFANSLEKFYKSVAYIRRQDLPAVLDAPYYMIIDVIYASPCVGILVFHTYSIIQNSI